MFDRHVLPISEDVMVLWRLLVDEGRKAGYTYSQPDVIIAAIALHHGMTLVTRNLRDYEKASVPARNPWVATRAATLQSR